jgi:hypothetical protein
LEVGALLFLLEGLNGIAIAWALDTGMNGRMVCRPVVSLVGFPFVPALATELPAVEVLRADGDPICSDQSANVQVMKRYASKNPAARRRPYLAVVIGLGMIWGNTKICFLETNKG